MSRKRSWTNEEFIAAVASSTSIHQVLLKLGLCGTGSAHQQFHRYVKELGLDTSHFTGQAHLKGKTHSWTKSIPLKEILIENSTYLCSNSLRKRLIKSGLLKIECYICGIKSWLNQPLSLQLDHINGVRNDNRKENLRLLCPNCHSQTSTFAGRNKIKQPQKKVVCVCCQVEFEGNYARKYCSDKCYFKYRYAIAKQ